MFDIFLVVLEIFNLVRFNLPYAPLVRFSISIVGRECLENVALPGNPPR